MDTLLDTLFHVTQEIRYVAVYSAGKLFIRQRPDLLHASASDSDRYEELLVNPTLLALTQQRGTIDCGGAGVSDRSLWLLFSTRHPSQRRPHFDCLRATG